MNHLNASLNISMCTQKKMSLNFFVLLLTNSNKINKVQTLNQNKTLRECLKLKKYFTK